MISSSKWTSVKEDADIMLGGVAVELDWTNNSIVGVKLTDESGNALRVTKGDYSELKVLVPATVDKFRLHGVYCGLDIDQIFDDEGSAEDKKSEITGLGEEIATLEITKVKVPA